MKEEYKGFEISLNERSGKFELTDKEGADLYQNESLKRVREYAVKLSKKGFKRVSVFVAGRFGDDGLEKNTVTSITPDGEAWVVDPDGVRTKLWGSTTIYKFNGKNIALFKEIEHKEKQREALEKEKEALTKRMEILTIKELREIT